MDSLESFLEVLVSVVDLLTAAYRVAYVSISAQDGTSVGLAALTTWLCGTFVTVSLAALLAFSWDATVSALRAWADTLLHRATLGANLRLTQTLVNHFVRLDQTAGVIQRLSGVVRQPPAPNPPPAFTRPQRGSRVSMFLLLAPSILRGLIAAVRYVLTTAWGLLTLAATWWAMEHPGLEAVRDWVRYGHEGTSAFLATAGISVIGLVVAVLTFMLSRLRGPVAIGRQAWRHEESSRACDELADREIEIGKALARLSEAEWAIHSSWRSALESFREASIRTAAEHEARLRRLLLLPEEPLAPRIARWEWAPPRRDPRELAVNQAAEALGKLRQYLTEVTGRREILLRRAAPWGVVQRVTRFHLKLAINDIDRYVTIRQHDPQLTSAETQARCLAAVASGAFIFGPPAEEFDFATIPEADRLDAVARAKKDWMREVDEATRDLEDIVHRTVVRGLIGIAELQAASDQVFAYLHPTGPLARLVERLRPA